MATETTQTVITLDNGRAGTIDYSRISQGGPATLIITQDGTEISRRTFECENVSLYVLVTWVRTAVDTDPEAASHGRGVAVSLIARGDYVWQGGWTPVDHWVHAPDGAVRLNHVWYDSGDRVLVHQDPTALKAEHQLINQAIYSPERLAAAPERIQRKVRTLAGYQAPSGTRSGRRLPRHSVSPR